LKNEIRSETQIEFTPEKVWQILLESPQFIPSELKEAIRKGLVGKPLKVRMASGARGATFKIKVTSVLPEAEIRWGYLMIRGLFDGEHSFRIQQKAPNKVLFIQSEKFSGVLVPFLSKTIRNRKNEFDRTNEFLKKKAEAGSMGGNNILQEGRV
jgi:hypothetical protein